MTIRVAIVEDNESYRKTVSAFLGQADGIAFVGGFTSGEAALEQLPGLKPDVVLMDVRLPQMSGIECMRALKTTLPEAQILMLTAFEDPDIIFEAIVQGATGYLLKEVTAEQLVDAVVELHDGGSPMTNSIARKVLKAFGEMRRGTTESAGLSPREEEILQALVRGRLYKEIADQLHVSYHTVRAHIRTIYKKLQVTSRADAVRLARGEQRRRS